MSGDTALVVVLALLGGAAVAGVTAWSDAVRRAGSLAVPLGTAVAVAAAGLVVATVPAAATDDPGPQALAVLLAAVAAVAGGGPLTTAVFSVVDAAEPAPAAGSGRTGLDAAASVLRGGAWIGVLERVAVFASLVAGLPEGIALALALKGLGRYAELKANDSGAAERFIIGTFVSVLWAAGCAAVVLAVR
ncbi:hypothetical protein [Nocardioides sp. SYSU D00038]|uniref:hypothetical protein n=1 Tax=Nocardioides sp. SYSU D00038 TaxID=2812554 RepID=UPI001966CF0F|nr:hypothetical protein [Nocardioides sp. SYSU D00038]